MYNLHPHTLAPAICELAYLDHRTTWQPNIRLCGNAFTLGVYVCHAECKRSRVRKAFLCICTMGVLVPSLHRESTDSLIVK